MFWCCYCDAVVDDRYDRETIYDIESQDSEDTVCMRTK